MLLLKLILVPTLIGLVSLAGRRWGPGMSGLLVGLPCTSGPVLFFLAVERGTSFASEAASGILGGVLSLTAFCAVYAAAARRCHWLPCAGLGMAVYFAATLALLEMRFPLAFTFALATLVLALSHIAMPRSMVAAAARAHPIPWDIPLRMLSATAIVVALTGFASLLGAHLAGLLAPFPVYASVLAVFSHRNEGPGAGLETLRGVIRGCFSFAIFFLVAAISIEPLGITPSLLAASVSAASLHIVLIDTQRLVGRRQPATPPG